ncbi:Uncharacterised protein [Mycobacteroides abscessus subsp. abscessus]|nr:Uncharacterised protein [Mycobacteroides abscessus subsp. abscessus]
MLPTLAPDSRCSASTVAPATPLFRKDVSAASRIARRRATPAFEAGGTPEEY